MHRSHETEGSLRIHGHTYQAEVTVTGTPDPTTGMIVDLALLRREINRIRELLDHQFLDEIKELGPATLENLCLFIKNNIDASVGKITSVIVERSASGDKCILRQY